MARIDKLDVAIPRECLRNDLAERANNAPPVHAYGTPHYAKTSEFVYAGIRVRFNLGCFHSRDRHHKLEILRAGELPLAQIMALFAAAVTCGSQGLRIMRLDLAVDIWGVTVMELRQNVTCAHVRTASVWSCPALEKTTFRGRGMGIELGRRPDFIRIYDKVAERQASFERAQARGMAGGSFFEWSGLRRTDIVTRVERQCCRNLPSGITTVGDLSNLAASRPFSRLRFRRPACVQQHSKGWSMRDDAMREWLRSKFDLLGYDGLRRLVNAHGRNFARLEARYPDFARGPTLELDLDRMFADGIRWQLS